MINSSDYLSHWGALGVGPSHELATDILRDVLGDSRIELKPLSERKTMWRLSHDVLPEFVVTKNTKNDDLWAQFPGSLSEQGLGYNLLCKLALAYDKQVPGLARLKRFDAKIDRFGRLSDIWPEKYQSKMFFRAPDAWDISKHGEPTNSFRLVNKAQASKYRAYDKILQLQDLMLKGHPLTATQRALLQEAKGRDVSRVEYELRGRHAVYGDSLLRKGLSETEFANNVAAEFMRNNPLVETVDGEERMPEFFLALDPLAGGKTLDAAPIASIGVSKRAVDDFQRTKSFVMNKFAKWGYTGEDALQFMLGVFCEHDDLREWFTSSVEYDVKIPTYSEFLVEWLKDQGIEPFLPLHDKSRRGPKA